MLVFNWVTVNMQVNKLREIANEMESMRRSVLLPAIDSTRAAWKGPTSQAFLTKCNELNQWVVDEVSRIREVAENLKRTANLIVAAEQAAQEVIRR